MPDFRLARMIRPPGCCLICGAFDVPLVEPVPELELAGIGQVYLCASNTQERSGCLVQAARVVGCLGEQEAKSLFDELFQAQERATVLEAEVARLGEPVVLSRAEYERLVGARTE